MEEPGSYECVEPGTCEYVKNPCYGTRETLAVGASDSGVQASKPSKASKSMVVATLAVCFVGLLAVSSIVVSVSTHLNMKAANDNTQLQQTMATVADQRVEIDMLKLEFNLSLAQIIQDLNVTQSQLIDVMDITTNLRMTEIEGEAIIIGKL